MPSEIKLIDFIRTGCFGLVQPGMTRGNVVSIMGHGDEGISFAEKHEWGAYKIVFDSGVYLSFDNFCSFWELDEKKTRQMNVNTNEKERFVLEGIRFYKY